MMVPAIYKLPVMIANQMDEEERDMVLLQGLCGDPAIPLVARDEGRGHRAEPLSVTARCTPESSRLGFIKGR